MKFNNVEELLEYTDNIKNKTFEEIDSKGLLKKYNLKKHKGLLGQVVETGFYKYPANNIAQADFNNIGVELKVTGYKINKNGTKRAKERLVLSMINYNEIINEEFEFSKLISKNKKILLIWYHYDENKDAKDYLITDYQLYNLEQDIEVIKNDFEIIKGKVVNGRAHELSEGNTSYLGACTKDSSSKNRTTQPNSPELAKRRAYSLKSGYLTGILRSINQEPTIKIKNNEPKTVLDFVKSKFEKYIGKTQIEIYKELFGEEPEKIPKQINKIISDKILGKDSELKETNELFKKTNYLIRNIPLINNHPKERMSFRNLVLSEFEENWDDSDWKNYFEENTFIIICYSEEHSSKNGKRVLSQIKQINFTDNDLSSMKSTYEEVKKTIETKNLDYLPRPKSFDGQILVIAPKAQKGKNIYSTFLDEEKTKVCFMLEKDFLNKKLNE